MDNVKLIKEDVLEAFKQSHFAFKDEHFTGVPAAAEEFCISRSAVHAWVDGKEIPAKRQLHLHKYRPDIIEKVQAICISRQDIKASEEAA